MHTSNSSSKVTNFTVTCCCCGKTTRAACNEYLLMTSELKQREFVWLHCKGGAPAALQGCISDKLATQGVSAVTMVTVCVCVCVSPNQPRLEITAFKSVSTRLLILAEIHVATVEVFCCREGNSFYSCYSQMKPCFYKRKKKKNLPACL